MGGQKITDWAAISNCYCIGTDYTLCSDQLEEYARNRRWLRPDEPLDFAKAYTLPPCGRANPRLVSADCKS